MTFVASSCVLLSKFFGGSPCVIMYLPLIDTREPVTATAVAITTSNIIVLLLE